MKPTAEKVLSVLVEMYAKQNGVRIEYIVDTSNSSEPNKATQLTRLSKKTTGGQIR